MSLAPKPTPPTRTAPEVDADDLDLPPLDGLDEEEVGVATDDLLGEEDPDADALDDTTGEGDPLPEIEVEGAEGGWLSESDEATALDVGPFDVVLSAEGWATSADEPDGRVIDDELGGEEAAFTADAGEEGPAAEDEELREEDLPALDADEGGTVDEDDLYDRSLLASDEELRWDDRAWAPVATPSPPSDDADDSGTLPTPGDDPTLSARDRVWRDLEQAGNVMAATLVPGGSVVLAVPSADGARAQLVRILPHGVARIVAEVDGGRDRDDDDCQVTALRWDAANGWLYVAGTFGSQAFRPA